MAAAAAEDDDNWLYGEGEKKEPVPAPAPTDTTDAKKDGNEEPTVNGQEKPAEAAEGSKEKEGGDENEDDDDDDDDDSSDDDVKINIKVEANKYKGAAYQRGIAAAAAAAKPVKGVDVDAVGEINGVPIHDYDISLLKPDERPWHKPGADITDYFNYGFTEDTWIRYCDKQRSMRGEAGNSKYSGHLAFAPPKHC